MNISALTLSEVQPPRERERERQGGRGRDDYYGKRRELRGKSWMVVREEGRGMSFKLQQSSRSTIGTLDGAISCGIQTKL